jgi:hypothetical protein
MTRFDLPAGDTYDFAAGRTCVLSRIPLDATVFLDPNPEP